MRRVALVGLCVALAAMGVSSAARAQTVVVKVGGELSAVQYQPFSVPIYADMTGAGGAKLGSYTIRVTWNPAVLSYYGYESGAFADPAVRSDSSSYGVLYVAAVSPAGMDSVFDLIRLDMEMWTPGTSPITVTVTELSAAGTFADLLPTVTVQNGTFCAALGRWGDLDGDGYANSRDALAILSHAVGIDVSGSFTIALGDVDGDGVTNTRDALILLSYAVGIDITGERVLLTAPGACGTGVVPAMAVLPDTADLVVGQSITLTAVATDGSGQRNAITGVNWEVEDQRVAAVTQDGVLTARDSGTTKVWAALGPGVRIAGTVVARRKRNVWFVNSQTASQRTIQMGNAEYPFASPDMAFPYLVEGDTVRIAPGVIGYTDAYAYLYVGAVFVGDTLADGSRPVLRPPSTSSGTAFSWYGGAHGELRNLILRDFYEAVYGGGIRNLVLDNVRIEETTATGYNDGLYIANGLDTLTIRNSEFLGNSAMTSGQPVFVSSGATLVTIADSRFANWNYQAYYGQDVDSTDIRRSQFDSISNYAVRVFASNRPNVAMTLVGNRFLGQRYYTVYGTGLRRAAMAGNYIQQLSSIPIYLVSVNQMPGTIVTSSQDSIDFRASGYNFLDLEQWDSVRVDGMWMRARPDSAIDTYSYIRGNYLEFTNSQFLNLTQEGLDLGARRIVVDNSTFQGCATCNWTGGTGISAAVYSDSGPSVSVTNSSFSVLGEAFWHGQSGYRAGPMVLSGNTVDSVTYGFRYYADSAFVADNVITRVWQYGVYGEQGYNTGRPPERTVLLRNRIGCTPTGSSSYGVYVYNVPLTADSSTVTSCDYGVYAYYSTAYPLADLLVRGDSLLASTDGSGQDGLYAYGRWGFADVSHNVVRRAQNGIHLLPDILAADTSSVRLDSNAISATTNTALYLYPYDAIPFSGSWNNISGNGGYGIYNYSTLGTRSFTLGRFVGNGNFSVYSTSAFDASQNWWGDPAGPCVYGTGCSGRDSIYTGTAVTTTSPLATDPTDVPGLLPPGGPLVVGPIGRGAAVDAPGTPATNGPIGADDVYVRLRAEARAAARQTVLRRQAADSVAHEAKQAELARIRATRQGRHPPR